MPAFNFRRMTESETSWETEAIHQQINKQIEFCGWQLFQTDEDDCLRIRIGSILHSKVIETGDIHNPLPLRFYVDIFNPEEREQIEKVFQKIREVIPVPNKINFGCTFVTVYEESKQTDEIILFRCTQPPSQKIFIESNGRTYKDWGDFMKSNKIQNGCEYFAPSNGVYTADGQIWKFKRKNVSRYFDTAFTVAGLVCIVATVEIPIISTVFCIAMYLYGAHRSVSTIIDRYQHKESTSNVETVFSYLTLSTICLTQLCIVMVSYKGYFFKEFGIHWCKLVFSTINGTVLCLDGISFVISLSIFYSKTMKDKKLTTSDMFNLLLQAFLLYEQAINTIEFLELLSDTSYFRSFQKMTKSQKRNWKKRKSKEAKKYSESKSNKIFEYQNDFFRLTKWFSNQILSRAGEYLMKNVVQCIMCFAGTIFAGIIANVWRRNRL